MSTSQTDTPINLLAAVKDEALWQARREIFEIADRTNTHGDMEDAARNLVEGKPAFWTNQGFGNQPASIFKAAANRLASIEAAQVELAEYFALNGRDVCSSEWLDTLVPLNDAAKADLDAARARTFGRAAA